MPKLLICGDVFGEFDTLNARLTKINSSRHGPFDALICAGEWFADAASTSSSAAVVPEFPIPVHVLGDDQSEGAGAESKDGAAGSSVQFLGR